MEAVSGEPAQRPPGTARVLLRLWALTATGLLVATLLLTVPRLLDPQNKYGVLLAALTPFGTLTALLAVLTTGPLVVRAGRRRLLAGTAAATAAILLVLHVVWVAPLYVGPRAQAAGDARVVVMTQNFETGDVAALERTVRAEGVDVLVICDTGTAQFAAAVRLADRVGLNHQVTDGGTAVFSRSPISGTSRISDGGSSRIVRLSGTPIGDITLYAVHPAPAYNMAKWAADYRRIHSAIASGPTARSVIAGDMNATVDNAPLRRLMDLGYTDAVSQVRAGWRPTWPMDRSRRVAGMATPAVLPIDHVLTSSDLAISRMAVVPLRDADHAGILAVIGPRG